MSASMSSPDDRATRLIRKATATPTLGFFRAFNFELYTRRAAQGRLQHAAWLTDACRNNAFVAVPGTVFFLGVLAYFAMEQSDRRQELQAEALAAQRRAQKLQLRES